MAGEDLWRHQIDPIDSKWWHHNFWLKSVGPGRARSSIKPKWRK